MTRWLAFLASVALAAPAAASTVQTGSVVSPGGNPVTLTPNTIYDQRCNAGEGGIAGQTYGDGVCAAATSDPNETAETSGTLSGLGQTVELTLPGSASAFWTIDTTNFVGTIMSEGCLDDACEIPGGRLLFFSGYGSAGRSSVTFTGGTVRQEFRLVAGGRVARLRVTAYTSGTLAVRGYAQRAPNLVFVNGPVHTADDEAVRAQRAFIGGTGVQAVGSGQFLYVRLSNPPGTGQNLILDKRLFGSNIANNGAPLEYQAWANCTNTLSQTANVVNRWLGAPSAPFSLTYQAGTGVVFDGTMGTGGSLPTGGNELQITTPIILQPGTSVCFQISGAGSGVPNAARINVSFIGYWEPLN